MARKEKTKGKKTMKYYNEYLTKMNTAHKSAHTINSYIAHIKEFFEVVGKEEEDITPKDILTWQGYISNKSTATINLKINAVNNYFNFLTDIEVIERNPMLKVDRPHIKNKEKPFISVDTIRTLIDNANNIRTKAMIIAYTSTGMRFSELANVTLADYNKAKADKTNMLTIVGKGDKERKVFLTEQAIKAIDKYLKSYAIPNQKYLFSSPHNTKVDNSVFDTSLRNLSHKCNLPFVVSAHSLRACCATTLADNGVNLAVIRDVLGHANISTTSRYIKTNTEQLQNAVNSLRF